MMNTDLRHERIEADPVADSHPAAASGTVAHAIQPAIWPEAGVSTEVLPYMRLSGAAGFSLSGGGIWFAPGGTARFDTYFNLFNLGKWRAVCGRVDPLLRLHGRGRFELVIVLAGPDRSPERVVNEVVTLSGTMRIMLPLPELDSDHAILFFELTALSDGRLDDFGWETLAPPRRLPRLMLSITTFRREAAVADTVERFRAFHAASPLRDHIRLTVVDNGRSLALDVPTGDTAARAAGKVGQGDGNGWTAGDGDAPPGADIAVIPNANLGGSGGFARGLIAARAAGATHCLFMDDDASVHMGAIERTWMCLAYATDPATAVAGAMIHADHRWQIWENGAAFDQRCFALHHGTDLRDRDRVFAMEYATADPAPPNLYGGWWYFAFPVDRAERMPFPFFVRGDDVSFSLANRFSIVTLPGVASFQESFTDKESPLTWYLDLRSHLAHHLSLPALDVGFWRLWKMAVWFYLRTVLRFHYETLSAVNLAIEDVMQGPEFFARNADAAGRRADLKALTRDEAWTPIEGTVPPVRLGRLSRPLRALYLLTLNGHLLPFTARFGSDLTVPIWNRGNFREVYGARSITYLNARRTASYTVRQDKRRFWRETWRFLRNGRAFHRAYPALLARWRAGYGDLTERGFWDKALDLPTEANPAGPRDS